MPYALNAGLRIHYQLEGSGPPLVLHTGFSQSLREWYLLGYVAALQDDYRLILLDPRGQGASDKPHDPEAYGDELRVADVVAVLDAASIDRAHFWGWSMGGRIGFALAKHVPERFCSLVMGGAAPFGGRPSLVWAELLRRGIEVWLAEGDEDERGMGPLPAEVRALRLTSDAEALAAASLMQRPNLESDLSSMTLPALIYCGEQDPAHDWARRAAGLMPNASFISLPGLNHRQVNLDAAAMLPHVRAFLQRVPEAPITRV
jgi:pimeloyl-ACP methyl ester carboxylesterase